MTTPDPHSGQQPQPRPAVPVCRVIRNGTPCQRILTDHNRHCPRNQNCTWCDTCCPNRDEGAKA